MVKQGRSIAVAAAAVALATVLAVELLAVVSAYDEPGTRTLISSEASTASISDLMLVLRQLH